MKNSRWSAEHGEWKGPLDFQVGSASVASYSFDKKFLEIKGLFYAIGQEEGTQRRHRRWLLAQYPKMPSWKTTWGHVHICDH